MSEKYPVTVEPMMFDRDRVVRAIRMFLDEWNLQAACRPAEKISLPDVRDELKYAIFYLNNDGAIREQLGIKPKFELNGEQIKLIVDVPVKKAIVRKRICQNCVSWSVENGVCINPVSPHAYDETGECDTCDLFENVDCFDCNKDCKACSIQVEERHD